MKVLYYVAICLVSILSLISCQRSTTTTPPDTSNDIYFDVPEAMEDEDLTPLLNEPLLEIQGGLFDGPFPADAGVKGAWSTPFDWPLIAIHAALLPNGTVFTFGTKPQAMYDGLQAFYHSIWKPQDGFDLNKMKVLANSSSTNLFCAGQILLRNGNLLIAGGDVYNTDLGITDKLVGNPDINIYNYKTQTMTRSPLQMLKGRWYPTMTTLANGEVLIQGGVGIDKTPTITPEVWNNATGWRVLTGASSSALYNAEWYYPWSFLAPNGKVFLAETHMWYLDPTGSGSLQQLQKRDNIQRSRGSAVMFDRGKILVVGGGGTSTTPPTNTARVIDINAATPAVSVTSSMSINRRYHDATLLADGKVLVTGGSTSYDSLMSTAVYDSELWNPATGQWSLGARANRPRMYHASALLLPNGTVLKVGGDRPTAARNFNAEIYYPAYLFKKDGSGTLAPRPVIGTVSKAQYAQAFSATFSGTSTISQVSLIGLGSVTHNFDMGQRFLNLSFSQSGNTLTIQAPASPNLAPPGYYMLFIINNQGVPSEAKIIKL